MERTLLTTLSLSPLYEPPPFDVGVADDHTPIVVAARMRPIGIVGRHGRSAVVVDQGRTWPVRPVAGREPGSPGATAVYGKVQQCRTVQRNARYHLRLVDMLSLSGPVAMIQAG